MKGVATTANRAQISSERGEWVVRGMKRGDETDGLTHVRSRKATLRDAAALHTRYVTHTCVRARMHPHTWIRLRTRVCERPDTRTCVAARRART